MSLNHLSQLYSKARKALMNMKANDIAIYNSVSFRCWWIWKSMTLLFKIKCYLLSNKGRMDSWWQGCGQIACSKIRQCYQIVLQPTGYRNMAQNARKLLITVWRSTTCRQASSLFWYYFDSRVKNKANLIVV